MTAADGDAAAFRRRERTGHPRMVRAGRHRLYVDDDQPTFWDRVEAGAWEPETFALLDRLVGPATTFVDLGAWVGALSLYAAANGARVLAVEADPRAQDQLRRNLAANPALAPRVSLIARAAAASAGPVRLGARRKPGDSMSSTLLADRAETWTAEAITPAEIAAGVEDGSALFVKVDIEGGEYALLPALAPLLDRPSCAVLVAFHPDILRESGTADPDAVARRAVRVFEGWHAFALASSGPVPGAGFGERPMEAERLFLRERRPGGPFDPSVSTEAGRETVPRSS